MINQLIEDADRWKARVKAAEARAEAAEAKVRELHTKINDAILALHRQYPDGAYTILCNTVVSLTEFVTSRKKEAP